MTNHCAICQGPWSPETGVVVGHPTELHVCDECFDESIRPIFIAHDTPAARSTDGPCLAHWFAGSTRIGCPVPKKASLEC